MPAGAVRMLLNAPDSFVAVWQHYSCYSTSFIHCAYWTPQKKYDQNPRLLGGSYEGSKFPSKFDKILEIDKNLV